VIQELEAVIIEEGEEGIKEGVGTEGGTVVQRTDYYPSGLPMTNGLYPDEQEFKYNGKEFDTMNGLNMYDYGARFYDAAIMRWCVVDPLAEKYFSTSPYVYCLNTPINAIDPDGRDVVYLNSPKSVAWQGHAAAIIQDGSGYWHYLSFAASNIPGDIPGALIGNYVKGTLQFEPTNTQNQKEALEYVKEVFNEFEYTEQVEFKTSSEMDAKIYYTAKVMQSYIENSTLKYHFYNFNCASAIRSIIGIGTGVNMPEMNSPRPNTYFKTLQDNRADIQRQLDKLLSMANAMRLYSDWIFNHMKSMRGGGRNRAENSFSNWQDQMIILEEQRRNGDLRSDDPMDRNSY